MIKSHIFRLSAVLTGGLAVLASSHTAQAQFFNYTGKGDLMAGFRKPGSGTYELVVRLGNVTDFVALTPGTTITITNFSSTQLTDAFPNYNNLSWSVFATFTGPPNSTYAGYQLNTIWYTAPRSDFNTQSTPPTRLSGNAQAGVVTEIDSIGKGAHSTSVNIGSNYVDNTSMLVKELASDVHGVNLSVYLSNPQNLTVGDFGGNLPSTVENKTPATFNSAVRSDLYQAVPNNFTDPNSGTTSGNAYYVGYFTLNPSGAMTFTRSTGAVVQTRPPPPQIVGITRVGNLSTIYFTTTNGSFTYGLSYTDANGLKTATSSWSTSPNTITGDGTTKSLTDTTTDPFRIYRVNVH